MGGSRWNEDHYQQQVTRSVSTHGTSFVHDHQIRTGQVEAKTTDDLDPRKMKGGRRESRDSAAHPESNAVIIALDVTGTMGKVVRQIHTSLPRLMGLLERKGYLAHPQICFCAVGDATTDRAPLQIGQFESGAEMEGDLAKFYIEGNGGGQTKESYELIAYFAARHTSCDCIEKRGKKGYLFIIGDEQPYPTVYAEYVRHWFNDAEAGDISTEDMFAEVAQLYHVFVILPVGSSYGDRYKPEWQELVGPENVIVLDKPEAAAEVIATQIGMCEGTTNVASLHRDLADVGTSAALVPVIAGAVRNVHANHAVGIVHTDAFTSGKGSAVERL